MTRLDLVCVKSTVMILRAGYANVLLFIGVILASLSWELLLELDLGRFAASTCAIGVFFVFVLYYSTFVSRIREEDGTICLVTAFSDIRIPAASITTIRMSVIGLSRFAKLTIEQRGDGRTRRFRLIAPATNIGTFESTVAALEKFARRHTK
jgi:hypothetical protein